MPRAEYSTDVGETFRRKTIGILNHLGYDIIGTKFAIKCKSEFHQVQEHTIDILGRHVHRFEPWVKKPIVVESKKTLPSSSQAMEQMAEDLANKIDCLGRNFDYLATDEGLVLSDSNPSLTTSERFKNKSRTIIANRSIFIALVAGSKFRIVEALSSCLHSYSQNHSTSIILPEKAPQKDLGTLCPMNLEVQKAFVCGMKVGTLRLSVFKTLGENYNSPELFEDIAWVNKYRAILDSIHSSTGYVDDVIEAVESMGMGTTLIDHYLQRTFFGDYPSYTRMR